MLEQAVKCEERQRLLADVTRTIERLIDILLDQQRALNMSGASALVFEEDFGLRVGEKERAIGALCEHEREHGCV